MQKARKYHAKLCEIALKPHNLSVKENIEVLIKTEEDKGGENLGQRIVALDKIKDLCSFETKCFEKDFDCVNIFKGCTMTHEVVLEERKHKPFFGMVRKIFRRDSQNIN